MTDDESAKASKPTPAKTLEQHITDVNIPKNEAEWWAHRRIAELEAENARLKDNIAFYGRWIGRGRYDEATTPEEAISVMVHYPGAPWKVGRWDVDDKPYAKRFYSDHPKARAALGEQP